MFPLEIKQVDFLYFVATSFLVSGLIASFLIEALIDDDIKSKTSE